MSEVDDKGQVLTQFTDVIGPEHLSTTSEDDVLVADYCILLLNSQLQLERVLLDTNSQVKPWNPYRLHYNKLTSQLYVLHDSSEQWSRPNMQVHVISQWSLR